jgi:transcriptional regulator with XRE-family HTH domain
MSFHIRLRQAREERRLTIEEAANLCGLSADDWALWEAGNDEPTVTPAVSIATAIDCNLEWLMCGNAAERHPS